MKLPALFRRPDAVPASTPAGQWVAELLRARDTGSDALQARLLDLRVVLKMLPADRADALVAEVLTEADRCDRRLGRAVRDALAWVPE